MYLLRLSSPYLTWLLVFSVAAFLAASPDYSAYAAKGDTSKVVSTKKAVRKPAVDAPLTPARMGVAVVLPTLCTGLTFLHNFQPATMNHEMFIKFYWLAILVLAAATCVDGLRKPIASYFTAVNFAFPVALIGFFVSYFEIFRQFPRID